MQYLAIGCRTAVGVVFLLAVIGKVVGTEAFTEFVQSVRDMKAVPPPLVALTARATLLAEASAVLLVAIPFKTAAVIGFAAAIVLTAAFSSAIARTVRSGNRASCRCFGRSSTPLGIRHLVRNGCCSWCRPPAWWLRWRVVRRALPERWSRCWRGSSSALSLRRSTTSLSCLLPLRRLAALHAESDVASARRTARTPITSDSSSRASVQALLFGKRAPSVELVRRPSTVQSVDP